jgi:hypothetical protein
MDLKLRSGLGMVKRNARASLFFLALVERLGE